MGTTVSLEMDPVDVILLRHGLSQGGPVQVFFAKECAKMMDPYIPHRVRGHTHIKTNYVVAQDGSYIQYNQPYAAIQYYGNRGAGMRGKEWDKRMWADRGDEIVRAVSRFAGI